MKQFFIWLANEPIPEQHHMFLKYVTQEIPRVGEEIILSGHECEVLAKRILTNREGGIAPLKSVMERLRDQIAFQRLIVTNVIHRSGLSPIIMIQI